MAQAVFYTPKSNMPSAAEKSIIIIGDGAVFLILLYPKCVSHRMAKTKMDLGSGASGPGVDSETAMKFKNSLSVSQPFEMTVIPGCILKMSRRRFSPGYMCEQ